MDNQKEMEEALKAINERVASFSAPVSGSNIKTYTSSPSLSGSNKRLWILTALLIGLVGVSIFLIVRSGGGGPQYKAPEGYEVVAPKNAPPILRKIK